MKSLFTFTVLFCAIQIALLGCGSGGSSGSTYGSSPAPTASHLVDGSGFTVYQYSGDTAGANVSNCTNLTSCYAAWPAVPGGEAIAASSGSAQQGSVSSFTRSNPSGTQATYAGKPLYYFVSDTAAGMATGNGLEGFTVVSP